MKDYVLELKSIDKNHNITIVLTDIESGEFSEEVWILGADGNYFSNEMDGFNLYNLLTRNDKFVNSFLGSLIAVGVIRFSF
jgi:hypothetical protein